MGALVNPAAGLLSALRIVVYYLMPNQIHLVAGPGE